ncbi:hypothetical protein WICANDRAFT_32212 [Wickerhamomyces anomalus NRRL Y-366-8]|uniref:Calcium permeable stress-gated cation channel 1 n=1 Tax=Wickerhamomyces anomalus (strain ATCC 58044 / CBS 1984 / NCYC 433 / NRRL Y-366-8) TaxID=683960 RepID=A0A1E3P132_WICAA|nr:uncharacterized protein WICANDRAFT_32212 [Wickerhamomyces anomalus NRRL Y-366-8]ODQ58627.1 hypothetical protein WICANDRAFT_32212 [Wickerhamomyces anomalus NRRL Y-366-8]
MSALPPDIDPTKQPQRVFKAQLIVSTVFGIFAFLAFCVLRFRWPHIYAVRVLRKKDIRILPSTLFGWCLSLYNVTDDEVLEHGGLDAYVFLGFFRMAIKYFALCSVISFCLIGPIRYYYTGHFDSDGIAWDVGPVTYGKGDHDNDPLDPKQYKAAWVYTVFTYIFSWLAYYFLWQQTEKVVSVRQRYLGQQNSVTDRTILLEGLPQEFDPNDYSKKLKKYIEELGIGKVRDIYISYNWDTLKALFKKREKILRALEIAYSRYVPLNVEVYTYGNLEPSVSPVRNLPQTETQPLIEDRPKPTIRLGLWGIFGEKVDAIDYYSDQLIELDKEIIGEREKNNFQQARSAFVTMDSVASAQMAAQAVLDPHVHRLIARLAPAPHDVCWDNISLTKPAKFLRANIITLIIGVSTVGLIFPVVSLSTLINLKTIEKFWPALGEWISKSDTAILIIGLIPPYIYTLLNVTIPYFYSYLSTQQGYLSNGEVELSTLSKNFFYIFFNLFLIFTLAGTASNVWALFGDTTKIAFELANSLKTLSLFYVDLILLQGLGMFPFKLLQVGDVGLEIVSKLFYCRTARDYRALYYTPPVFDFGIILPQHILILIITMIYSVTSTKIVTAGLVYYVLGYYTYKYQLLYTMVHPQHSTGQAWPMIFRRVCLGLVLFQITMAGTLALEHAFILSILVVPLIFMTLFVAYNFEKDYLPLSFFIALKAIKKYPLSSENVGSTTSGAQQNLDTLNENTLTQRTLKKRRSTIDEAREEYKTYKCPYLTDPLDGPIIGFDGDYIQQIQYEPTSLNERVVRKYYSVSEWE